MFFSKIDLMALLVFDELLTNSNSVNLLCFNCPKSSSKIFIFIPNIRYFTSFELF